MVSEQTLRDMANAIVREFQPERIILFGSYAYGAPTPGSDVDPLVVMRLTERPRRMATEIAMRVHGGFPLDLFVRSPARVAERVALNDGFILDITHRGKVLYVAAGVRVGLEVTVGLAGYTNPYQWIGGAECRQRSLMLVLPMH